MAIIFDLQMDFLDVEFNQAEFTRLLQQQIRPYKEIDFHPLQRTFVMAEGSYLRQLCVIPMNVGLGVSCDKGGCIHDIDDDECLSLSLHMYEFINGLPYFQLALVGWEIGCMDDFLQFSDKGGVIGIAEVEGLVVANRLFHEVRKSDVWVAFDKDHQWIPCESALGNLFGDDEE